MTTDTATTNSQASTGSVCPAAKEASRADQARHIVRRNVYWALGAGLVPIPVFDFVALTAVQVKMLKQLSDHYRVEFFDDKAKKIVGSLLASTGSLALAGMVGRSLFKLVPVVGQLFGVVGVPLFAGALTQAIGNLFVMHYETGGTLLDFNVEQMRAHFQREFERAKDSVKQMDKGKDAPASRVTAPVKVEPDNLEKIEGIGPAISELLYDAGIMTYKVLSETPVQELRNILSARGSRFAIADPSTWPEQAALLAKGDLEGFKKLEKELKAGKSAK